MLFDESNEIIRLIIDDGSCYAAVLMCNSFKNITIYIRVKLGMQLLKHPVMSRDLTRNNKHS